MLVIDDQRTFADLLSDVLDRQPGVGDVVAAYDLDSGLALVEELHPDVVVLDVRFAGDTRDGVDTAREIRSRHPRTRIVVLTGHSDAALIGRATIAGVSALLAKSGALGELLRAVSSDGAGLMIDPLFIQSLNARSTPDPSAPELTRRETDVLSMLALGLDARTISTQLDISLNTCRSYIKTMLSKLHAHSQLEAVAIAWRLGLLGPQVEAPRASVVASNAVDRPDHSRHRAHAGGPGRPATAHRHPA